MADKTETGFDPTQTSGLYDELRASWELNRDFGEMHLSILEDGTYLDQFGTSNGDKASEPAAQYTKRKKWSFALDHCQDLIGLRVDNLFRTPPKRKYDKSPFKNEIEAFLANVDGSGTSMDNFMRRALIMYYTNGVDIVVDKQAADAQPANQAQEDRLGIRSYLHAFGPLARVDWAVDHAGRYQWVRYDLGTVPAADETEDEPGIDRYLTMTRNEWRLYEVPTTEGGQVTVTTAPHSLDGCPVVTFYFKESTRADYPKVPLSLLTRIAPIARYLLNLLSQIQIDIYCNICFLAITGIETGDVPTEITPMGAWALPDGADVKPISGDVDHITEKRAFAMMLIESILRIGKLAGHSGDLKSRATSGVQVAVERTDLDNEMQMTAAQAEAVEEEIVRMAISRNHGKSISADELNFSVEYNTNFVLAGADEIIQSIRALVETDTHVAVPEPLRMLMRQLIAALTNENDEGYAKAMEQIEAMVPETILASTVKGENETDKGGGDVDDLTL